MCGFLEEDYGIDFGYRYTPKVWRNGIGFDVAKLVLNYGIKKLKLYKILALTHEDNHGSIRILEKLDFIKKNFGNLEQVFDLTFAVAILYIVLYPFWFVSLAKDAFINSRKPEEDYKPSRFAFIGVHIPLLLCWSAFWLYIINLIIDYFYLILNSHEFFLS